jgi:hypothetical protein
MNTGIKISKTMDDKAIKGFYLASMPAYLFGAQLQIGRYKDAASTLHQKPIEGVYRCLHEASSLFEDLATLEWYFKLHEVEPKGYNSSWTDARNHLRHDLREDLGKGDKRTVARVERLKLEKGFMSGIGFTESSIKVGGTEIAVDEIEKFLVVAGEIVYSLFEEGVENGSISSNPLVYQKAATTPDKL